MRMPHTPYHWMLVALVAGAFLLAMSEARGQARVGTGAAAVFEGRPAMAGAQAGPPQGGIGVQGSDDLARPVRRGIGKPKPKKELAAPKDAVEAPRDGVSRPRDTSMAKDQRSAAKKGARAARSTLRRARTGVGEIGSRGGEGG